MDRFQAVQQSLKVTVLIGLSGEGFAALFNHWSNIIVQGSMTTVMKLCVGAAAIYKSKPVLDKTLYI